MSGKSAYPVLYSTHCAGHQKEDAVRRHDTSLHEQNQRKIVHL